MPKVPKDITFSSNSVLSLDLIKLQMEKDLATSGISHSFASLDPKGLIDELADVLVFADRAGVLPSVLYRIDVTEGPLDGDHYTSLSAKCWDRVFRKVWFRTHFKTESK